MSGKIEEKMLAAFEGLAGLMGSLLLGSWRGPIGLALSQVLTRLMGRFCYLEPEKPESGLNLKRAIFNCVFYIHSKWDV